MSNQLTTIDEDDVKPVSQEVDNFLRAQNIVEAINANLPEGDTPLAPIPKDFVFKQMHRGVVNDAFNGAFALLGGVSGLMKFANDNPKEFYTLWAKLNVSENAGATNATTVIVQSAVPTSSLDMVGIHTTGGAYIVDAELGDLSDADD